MNDEEIHIGMDDELLSKDQLLLELQTQQRELEKQNRELLKAHQQLKETRDRYADLYDFSPVGYLTLDEHGVVRDLNLTGSGMIGKERSEIVDQPFAMLLAEPSIKIFSDHLQQVFLRAGNCAAEIQINVAGKSPMLVSLESLAVTGEKKTCRTIMHDVTEQRKMKVDLQVNRSAQDALLNAIPALVFYLDTSLKFLNISQTYADFSGFTQQDIVGKTVYDIFARDVADDLHQTFTSVLQTGTILYGFESTVEDASGSLVCLSTVLAPYRDFQGSTIGLVGVSIDISMIKSTANVNGELLVQNRKLTRNLFVAQEQERRNLARELHDELGQWFTAIQAEAQAICNLAKDTPNIHESALSISSSARKVHEVIRGMLRKLRPSLLDELGLADSLRELERQWRHSQPHVACVFKLDICLETLGEELNITLYRLVQEGLNNVANHAHAKRVMVSLNLERDSMSARDYIFLRIVDDGLGFNAKFVRAGIGLLGMRERVIAAEGDFYIDSTPGEGTSILVKLPLLKIKAESF